VQQFDEIKHIVIKTELFKEVTSSPQLLNGLIQEENCKVCVMLLNNWPEEKCLFCFLIWKINLGFKKPQEQNKISFPKKFMSFFHN